MECHIQAMDFIEESHFNPNFGLESHTLATYFCKKSHTSATDLGVTPHARTWNWSVISQAKTCSQAMTFYAT